MRPLRPFTIGLTGLTLAVGSRGDALVAWVAGEERVRAAHRPRTG
ncbi:MAG: hypothetical protein WKF99_00760 [Solirubrobacteraceae bacterium]